MRVCVLTPYTEPHFGGITSYAREIARGYGELGLEVLGLSAEGHTNSLFRVLGRRKLLFVLHAFVILLRWKPDVVHAHSHWHLLLPGVLLRALRPGTRLIFTFHTPWQDSRHSMRFAALAFLLRFPTLVTFVSHEMKDTMRLPPSVRQAVVYGAPEGFVEQAIHMQRDPSKNPSILYIGPMVWPDKVAGLLLLLHAFSGIADSHPNWRLTIVGDGPLRQDVERKTESLGLRQVVEMRGWVKDPAIELATADIYAQITLQEGLPLSVLNAMAMGLPVIATPAGGIPEVISDSVNGCLVPPKAEPLASALAKLMDDENLRRQLGGRALQFARQRTWRTVAAEYLTGAGKGR